eukprot:scaffold3964_cov126-Isochrysis_galbana.AAC.13
MMAWVPGCSGHGFPEHGDAGRCSVEATCCVPLCYLSQHVALALASLVLSHLPIVHSVARLPAAPLVSLLYLALGAALCIAGRCSRVLAV